MIYAKLHHWSWSWQPLSGAPLAPGRIFFNILLAAVCTAGWLPLPTLRKLLTQSSQILGHQASFGLVTIAQVWTGSIRVN